MSEGREGPIGPDELIGKLVPDPSNPGVKRVVGFGLGESDREPYWRLYLNPDLTEYLEFRKEDCLHGEEHRQDRTTVWLKRDARVTFTRTEEAALAFVRGRLRERFLRSTGFAMMARNNGGGGLGNQEGTGGCFATNLCCCASNTTRGFQETSDLCEPA
jgi:hypothetical protein